MGTRLLALSLLTGCAAPAAVELPTVLVADAGKDAVVRVVDGALEHIVAAPAAPIVRPAGLLPDGEGFWLANFGHGEVLRCVGDAVQTLFFDPDLLEEPAALERDGDDLWVLGNDTRNIVVLGLDGGVRQVIADSLLRDPHDLLLADGLLYVATSPQGGIDGTVQVRDPADGALLAVWGDRDLDAISLAQAPDGRLFVADWNGRIAIVGPDGVETWAELPRVVDLAFGPDGALWVLADEQLWRLDPEDGAVLDAPRAGFEWPRAIAFEP